MSNSSVQNKVKQIYFHIVTIFQQFISTHLEEKNDTLLCLV